MSCNMVGLLLLLILIVLVAGPLGLVAAGGLFVWLLNDAIHQWWFWAIIILSAMASLGRSIKS